MHNLTQLEFEFIKANIDHVRKDLATNFHGARHAAKEGILAEDHIEEHQDRDEARQAAEAGGGHRSVDGEKGES